MLIQCLSRFIVCQSIDNNLFFIYTHPLMSDSPSALHQQAIAAALSADWEKALSLNEQILAVDPGSIDALNRLGKANFELGRLAEAKECFEKSLKIDPYNQIAGKFIKRVETYNKKGAKFIPPAHQPIKFDQSLFIEEPGKTQVVTLLKVTEPQKLSLLSAGMLVNLAVKNRGVTVTDDVGEYLGVLPDDISHRLIKLMHGGNKYQACIKTVKTNGLSILIRETYRSARFRNQPSFLEGLNTNFTYSSNHIIIASETEEESIYEEMGEDEDNA